MNDPELSQRLGGRDSDRGFRAINNVGFWMEPEGKKRGGKEQ